MAYDEKKKGESKSFKQQLGSEELAAFNAVAKTPFAEQAQAFLNAYWHECKGQADFIYNVAWPCFRASDMQFKGTEYIHKYKEGLSLDFDAGIHFFEQMCKDKTQTQDSKTQKKYPKKYWLDSEYKASWPTMKTSIVRKKEFKKKVDVNFDNHISFLEYLLYQYEDLGCKPQDFCEKIMSFGDEPVEVTKARIELNKLLEIIAKYEAKKAKLQKQAESKGSSVKRNKAINMLAQIESSPLKLELNAQLITAQAKVRIALRTYGMKSTTPGGTKTAASTFGSAFWLKSGLDEANRKYKKK